MEAGVTVLNYTVLVFHPHKHVVRVKDVLADLSLLVLTESKSVFAFIIGLAVDGFENVLGVILEHLLRLFG